MATPEVRQRGGIRRHGNGWQARVSAGFDPSTGERIGVRRSPLAENTLRRIRIGLSRFDGPFIAELRGGGPTARSVRQPLATLTPPAP
jgi:hypothetical protein